jgi:hypothetical protein
MKSKEEHARRTDANTIIQLSKERAARRDGGGQYIGKKHLLIYRQPSKHLQFGEDVTQAQKKLL